MQIITTNAYGVQPNYYQKAFPDEDWYSRMLLDAQIAARLAVEARRKCSQSDVRVFGCLPPICESHNPAAFNDYVESNGIEFVIEAYSQVF